jgi:hypothetical protein
MVDRVPKFGVSDNCRAVPHGGVLFRLHADGCILVSYTYLARFIRIDHHETASSAPPDQGMTMLLNRQTRGEQAKLRDLPLSGRRHSGRGSRHSCWARLRRLVLKRRDRRRPASSTRKPSALTRIRPRGVYSTMPLTTSPAGVEAPEMLESVSTDSRHYSQARCTLR